MATLTYDNIDRKIYEYLSTRTPVIDTFMEFFNIPEGEELFYNIDENTTKESIKEQLIDSQLVFNTSEIDERITQYQEDAKKTTDLTYSVISVDDYKNAYTNFSNDAKTCFEDYVNRGSELNFAIRTMKVTSLHKKLIKCLQNYFKTVETLFPGVDYISVYRRMTGEFDPSKTSGFMSTSNVPLGSGKFGEYEYFILIPKDVPIGIADLTDKINGVYEIILPQNVQFAQLNCPKESFVNCFVVVSEYFKTFEDRFPFNAVRYV